MTPVENLLERLEAVKQTGKDRWIARCPAHDDNSPSLSIRDVGETFLVKCWVGCHALDVMEAVNLSPSDFWDGDSPKPARPSITVKELARVLDRESWITIICAKKVLDGELTEAERDRLMAARRRMTRVLENVNGRR